MSRNKTHALQPIVRRFVEDAGNLSQSFGVGRVIGQIYAYLYFSEDPHTLGDMQEALGISKGSASTGVRQLEQWGAVRKVWVKGDRKDYYQATDWLGQILKNAVLDTVGKKMTSYTALLDDAEVELNGDSSGNGEMDFVRDRVEHLRRFHERARGVMGSKVVRMFLK